MALSLWLLQRGGAALIVKLGKVCAVTSRMSFCIIITTLSTVNKICSFYIEKYVLIGHLKVLSLSLVVSFSNVLGIEQCVLIL